MRFCYPRGKETISKHKIFVERRRKKDCIESISFLFSREEGSSTELNPSKAIDYPIKKLIRAHQRQSYDLRG